MSEAVVMSRVREQDMHIVAGPHWSWGDGYTTTEAARVALRSVNGPAYGYTRCEHCGHFVMGLHELPHICAGCNRGVRDSEIHGEEA